MTPSAPMTRLGEVALLVLDDGQLARSIDERGIGRQAVGEALADAARGSIRRRSSNTPSTSSSPPIDRMAASRPLARPS